MNSVCGEKYTIRCVSISTLISRILKVFFGLERTSFLARWGKLLNSMEIIFVVQHGSHAEGNLQKLLEEVSSSMQLMEVSQKAYLSHTGKNPQILSEISSIGLTLALAENSTQFFLAATCFPVFSRINFNILWACIVPIRVIVLTNQNYEILCGQKASSHSGWGFHNLHSSE